MNIINKIKENKIHFVFFLTITSVFATVYFFNWISESLDFRSILIAVFGPYIICLTTIVFPETLVLKKYRKDSIILSKKRKGYKKTIKKKTIESLIFNSGITPIVITDSYNKVIKINESYRKLLGYEDDDLDMKGKEPTCISAENNNPETIYEMHHALAKDKEWSGKLTEVAKNGRKINKRVFIKEVYNDENELTNYLYTFHPINEKFADFDKHKKMAMYDELTGIPNRNLFLERIKMCINEDIRNKTISAVMFLDLDNFKNVNDIYGHDYGDIVLQMAAKRIRNILRTNDTVARIGGDEFSVILRNIKDRSDAGKVAKNIIKELEKDIIVDKYTFHISASIGISITPQDSDDIGEILKYSDLTMYKAKRSGKGVFEYFNNEIKLEFEKQACLKEDIKIAIENKEFEIYYLPQLNTKTGKIVAAEGLIRWVKESMIINPGEFIPVAEKNGYIYDLDIYVLKSADEHIDFIKSLLGNIDLKISINMSLITINKLIQADIVLSEINNASSISIEITESSISGSKSTIDNSIKKLQELGFSIIIDDFGSGHSSLSHISNLPVSAIKIDPIFIKNIKTDVNANSIIGFVKNLGDSLDATVVAKGLESKDAIKYLEENDIYNVQGFAISRPLSINALVDFVDVENKN